MNPRSDPAAPPAPETLAAQVRSGNRRAVARLISLLEDPSHPGHLRASRCAAALPLPDHSIGVTGPPGAGKSTLLDYLIGLCRAEGRSVGVLAIDPSSPFTGGALLGDRIRMTSHRSDKQVFIRSMGSRGARGGLAAASSLALRVLGGAGFEVVFLETVGAGQAETEIVGLADTVCVVQVPGLGDDIQLMKMGILETADLFVVNKGDRPGAQNLQLQLQQALDETPGEKCRALRQLGPEFAKGYRGKRWTPRVLLLSALERSGGEALLAALKAHRDHLRDPALAGPLRRDRVVREIIGQVLVRCGAELAEDLGPGGSLAGLVEECLAGRVELEDAIRAARQASGGRGGKGGKGGAGT